MKVFECVMKDGEDDKTEIFQINENIPCRGHQHSTFYTHVQVEQLLSGSILVAHGLVVYPSTAPFLKKVQWYTKYTAQQMT